MPTLDEVFQFAKTVMPWITGGVAGTLIGFALNRRVAQKQEARLSLTTIVSPFSISGDSPLRQKLSVSYGGSHYEQLALCECVITNPSERTIEDVSVVFEFDPKARTIDDPIVERSPVPAPSPFDRKDLHPHMLRCSLGIIDRRATVLFRILIDGPTFFRAHIRAKGDPAILERDGSGAQEPSDRAISIVLSFFAMYVMAGAIPFIGGAFQAAVILLSMPFLAKGVRILARSVRGGSDGRPVTVVIEKQIVGDSAVGDNASGARPQAVARLGKGGP